MHILVIPSWYPSKACEARGSFIRDQILAYQAFNTEARVGVIIPHLTRFMKRDPQKQTCPFDSGVPTVTQSIKAIPKCPSLNTKRLTALASKLYQRYVTKYGQPDVIHAHGAFRAGICAYGIHRTSSIPYMITEHGSAFHFYRFNAPIWHDLWRTFTGSACNIAVSHSLAKQLCSQFGSHFKTIPNMACDDFWSNYPETARVRSEFVFTIIAGLKPNKRIDLVLHAFASHFRGHNNVRLVIGGDGPKWVEWQQLAHDLGIERQVSWRGQLSRAQVRLLMQETADALMVASDYESFGMTLIEALASGIPIIATRCGGPEEIVTSEVGYLVSKGDKEALAQAMAHCYRHGQYWRDHKQQLSQYCTRYFSSSAIMPYYHQLYRNLAGMDRSRIWHGTQC